MPSGLTRQRIEAIAALANLELEPSEVELFSRQLGEILSYADQVQQVDTAGVAPTASVVTRPAADRDDRIAPSLDVEAALRNAPDPAPDSGFFKVPRVIG
jgi:aspartyl-tRNA(Asn)/glutamyl-tRNA(Gln) amidotransferase subunit C